MTEKSTPSAIPYAPFLLAFVLLCAGCGKSNSNSTEPGSAQKKHSVTLTWTPSTSSVTGYNVYRESASGGPTVKVTSQPVMGHEFKDANVEAGKTYIYYVTSVDSRGVESTPTNKTLATVPSP